MWRIFWLNHRLRHNLYCKNSEHFIIIGWGSPKLFLWEFQIQRLYYLLNTDHYWPHYFKDNFLVCELAMFIAALMHSSHGFDCIIDIMACVCKESDSDSLVYVSKVFVTLQQLRSLWFQQKEQYSLGPKIPSTNVSKKSKSVGPIYT